MRKKWGAVDMTKEVKITFYAEIDDTFEEELKGIVENHIDYMIDTNEYPEIKRIFGATCEPRDQLHIRFNLQCY